MLFFHICYFEEDSEAFSIVKDPSYLWFLIAAALLCGLKLSPE